MTSASWLAAEKLDEKRQLSEPYAYNQVLFHGPPVCSWWAISYARYQAKLFLTLIVNVRSRVISSIRKCCASVRATLPASG
jgi:hypothetical protein